jgi:hypothetical protein
MHKSKSSPESDTLQAIATLRQRTEGNEHPGLHLSHPLLFLILVAAAGRCLLFLRPLPIAAEEVCARAHRRRGIAAGHGAAAAQHGSRRRGAAGAAIRVVEALRPRGHLGVRERAAMVVAVVPTRRRRRKAGAGLVRNRRLQRHVLDLKTQEKIPSARTFNQQLQQASRFWRN